MTPPDSPPLLADGPKRTVLLTILGLSWAGSNLAWYLMESLGTSSPVLRLVFGANLLFHPTMAAIVWQRLLPLRIVDLSCLSFASAICAGCMALRFYGGNDGAAIDLEPLYLWIPVIYVFAFTLEDHQRSLKFSLANLAFYIAISLPYIMRDAARPHVNFTIQLHLVSAVLIAALYFFSSYLHRFQTAQLTVDELARLANTDDLTKLANRRRMAEAIEYELARSVRYEHPFSLLVFDIDDFKAVNDRFGHSVGDQTLVALAARAKEVLREVDLLGRWGGDEFLVILPETRYDDTVRKATELCAHIAAAPLLHDHSVTISGGVTSVIPGDTARTLVQRADVALYAAKRGGRNRVEGVLDGETQLSLALP